MDFELPTSFVACNSFSIKLRPKRVAYNQLTLRQVYQKKQRQTVIQRVFEETFRKMNVFSQNTSRSLKGHAKKTPAAQRALLGSCIAAAAETPSALTPQIKGATITNFSRLLLDRSQNVPVQNVQNRLRKLKRKQCTITPVSQE